MLHDETQIAERQATRLRAMTDDQRADLVDGLRSWAWELKRAGIANDNPGWSTDQVERRVRELFADVRA